MFFIPLRERACVRVCVCVPAYVHVWVGVCMCVCGCGCGVRRARVREMSRILNGSKDIFSWEKITFSDCYQELGFFSWKCFSIKQMRSKISFEQLFDFFHQVFNLAGCCNKKAKEASHNRKCQGQLEAYCPKMSFGLPATHQWSHFQLTNFQQTLFQRTHFQLTLFKAAWALYAIFSFSDVPELLIW